MLSNIRSSLFGILLLAILSGCAGDRTFHEYARAGDSVAIAAGWKHYFSRDNITVTFTPSAGAPVTYLPGDPALRGSINFYPDPISSAIVSRETNQDITLFAQTYAQTITANFTAKDKDWWQTMIILDLPPSLPVGLTTVDISNPEGEATTATFDVIDGVGSPNTLSAEMAGPLQVNHIAAFERVDHFTVDFTASTIPYAIEINLMHDPDVDNGGAGRSFVSNPRGDLKNLMWTDDGINTRVILMTVGNGLPDNMNDFKFYLAGGITNLSVMNVTAYDINGVVVPGVVATIAQ